MTNTSLGLSKESPIEISDPSIYNEFTTQHRNRVWVKYNCSKCGKEVITQYIYWNYIKDPTKLNKFQCKECNCRDTKQPYYDKLNERDRQYENSFEHTEDGGYKIIHDIEEMKRLATNSERIAYHCENPDCTYHNQWFKMDLAKKDRIGEYIKFGKLLCENCRFKLNYNAKHAIEERRKTFQEHWGTDHFMKNEEFKKDYFDNLEKKYGKGVKSTLTLPEVKVKTADTNLSKFGVIHPSSNVEIAKKISNTQLSFSTEKKERIASNRVRKYIYYGQMFDSSWEIALWIYAKDHNIPIYRCPFIFRFKYKDKTFTYNPDFLYNNIIIEIKGDQFINENGKLYLPYRQKEWTDEQYEYMCGLYEAKYQCMLINNVNIWFKKDIMFALNYIYFTYGKDYLKQFKLTNPFNPSYYNSMKSIVSYPIYPGKGITPYDLKEGEEYSKPGLSVTPFDIHK